MSTVSVETLRRLCKHSAESLQYPQRLCTDGPAVAAETPHKLCRDSGETRQSRQRLCADSVGTPLRLCCLCRDSAQTLKGLRRVSAVSAETRHRLRRDSAVTLQSLQRLCLPLAPPTSFPGVWSKFPLGPTRVSLEPGPSFP